MVGGGQLVGGNTEDRWQLASRPVGGWVVGR